MNDLIKATNDLIKDKLDIAKQSGELYKEIENLKRQKYLIDRKKQDKEGIKVVTSNHESFYSGHIDNYSLELHDLIISYLDNQISIREQKIDDLIKILK